MPELPEVELIVRDINRRVVGLSIAGVEIFWEGYIEGIEPGLLGKTLIGQHFMRAERCGKFILLRLDSVGILNHLRMTGNITKLSHDAEFPQHTHVALDLSDGDRLAFSDTRKFGRLQVFSLEAADERIGALGLGLDPFEGNFAVERLAELLNGRKRSIKSAMLDQRLIAGIGNIYACEILFRAALNPLGPAGSLSKRELARFVEACREVLSEAINHGGSSISDYRSLDGESGNMQKRFMVYDRENEICKVCGSAIVREVLNGRSTYWCPRCQK